MLPLSVGLAMATLGLSYPFTWAICMVWGVAATAEKAPVPVRVR